LPAGAHTHRAKAPLRSRSDSTRRSRRRRRNRSSGHKERTRGGASRGRGLSRHACAHQRAGLPGPWLPGGIGGALQHCAPCTRREGCKLSLPHLALLRRGAGVESLPRLQHAERVPVETLPRLRAIRAGVGEAATVALARACPCSGGRARAWYNRAMLMRVYCLGRRRRRGWIVHVRPGCSGRFIARAQREAASIRRLRDVVLMREQQGARDGHLQRDRLWQRVGARPLRA
jgi:hypothetical protein